MANFYGLEDQHICEVCDVELEAPFILMNEPRPDYYYVANADGTWRENLELKAQLDSFGG